MKRLLRIPCTLGFIALSACNEGSDSSSDVTENAAVVDTSETACYQVNLVGNWTTNDHGTLPDNAHFTTPVFIVHDGDYQLFKAAESYASAGLESLAETGNTLALVNEISGNADVARSEPFSDFRAPTSSAVDHIKVSKDFPRLSMASMIAPTPDWFIGLAGVSMIDEQSEFVSDVSMNVGAYDAGTEEGVAFSLDNLDAIPHVQVERITTATSPFTSTSTTEISPSLATITLTKVDALFCDS